VYLPNSMVRVYPVRRNALDDPNRVLGSAANTLRPDTLSVHPKQF
jgi:hypothetical protein